MGEGLEHSQTAEEIGRVALKCGTEENQRALKARTKRRSTEWRKGRTEERAFCYRNAHRRKQGKEDTDRRD